MTILFTPLLIYPTLTLSLPAHNLNVSITNNTYHCSTLQKVDTKNKAFVVVNNQTIINSNCDISSSRSSSVKIKKTLVKMLGFLLLCGMVAFMTAPALSYAAASTTSSSTSRKFHIIFSPPVICTLEAIQSITLILFSIPLTVALITGFNYFKQLFESDVKTLLMLQVGVLDKTRNLQRFLAQIADSSNSDCLKLKVETRDRSTK